ncbi:MAG TPA: cobyrinate a,c-diamide synthase [Gemmatimonadaceae bacterium]|jgi:cobyrinic acid a,c-diamide synthase|nr:cobyrinate a,c-diamide synthase [Gemmatimonadaceae bacterium]
MNLTVPRIVIAAPASGTGKTTVAVALIRTARDRGMRVAPFKVGPDYVDPSHHTQAAGRASRNLDGWMLPHATCLGLFARATTGAHTADLAVIEGLMGLFDGRSASAEDGSTAQMAKLLRAPIVLVLNAGAMGRTAAAVVHGLHTFDPTVRLAGVVLNRIASYRHYQICETAIRETTGVPVLGWLPNDPAIAVPERHLGLVLAGEHPVDLEQLARRAAETLDIDTLLRLAATAPPVADVTDPFPTPRRETRARIAVARDAAFDFYYEDNLDLLESLGAELVPFSPLADAHLPPAVDALYLGGGYPELHAARLAGNTAMRSAVRTFVDAGHPVYAECGGLMYLAQALVTADDTTHPMVGIVAGTSHMTARPTLAYREAEALWDSPIARAGQTIRGHEFHYSVLQGTAGPRAYRDPATGVLEGLIAGPTRNVLASYLHVHFGTDPSLAERFVTTSCSR